MTSLLENWIPSAVIGLLTTTVFAAGFVKTGRKAMFIATGIAALVTGGLVLLEQLVVTEREKVENVIYDVARAVQNNDVDAALAHLHPEAKSLRNLAANEFRQWKFSKVSVKNNLTVELGPGSPPRKATASFNVVVVVSEPQGMIAEQTVPRFVKVTLLRDGEQWKVSDYEPTGPMGEEDMWSHRSAPY